MQIAFCIPWKGSTQTQQTSNAFSVDPTSCYCSQLCVMLIYSHTLEASHHSATLRATNPCHQHTHTPTSALSLGCLHPPRARFAGNAELYCLAGRYRIQGKAAYLTVDCLPPAHHVVCLSAPAKVLQNHASQPRRGPEVIHPEPCRVVSYKGRRYVMPIYVVRL
jgi:hypothetical protein